MGFLSGLVGGLGGGGTTKGKAGYSSGFGALPSEIQGVYKNFATGVDKLIPGAASAFTPLQQTADETSAFNTIRQGFAPTADSLSADIGMLTNPWDDFVLGDVNRQAAGDYSILKQDIAAAGQFGSNRQRLGANDIEQTRLGTIGKLRQGQYDSALQNVFSNLIPQRQADAAGKLGIGEFQRNLAGQTAQAPYTGMLALAQALGALPKDTSQAQTSSSQSSGGNPLQAVGTIASIAGMLSDIRAKENVEFVGFENGWRMYSYNYIGDSAQYVGVIAQDVVKTRPDAITLHNGLMVVDYEKIGVNFYAVTRKKLPSYACYAFLRNLLRKIPQNYQKILHWNPMRQAILLPYRFAQRFYTRLGKPLLLSYSMRRVN